VQGDSVFDKQGGAAAPPVQVAKGADPRNQSSSPKEIFMSPLNRLLFDMCSTGGLRRGAWLLVFLGSFSALAAHGQDVPRVEGTAPRGHELLKHQRGGAYFIARTLKEDYERLLAQVKALKQDLEAQRITGLEAERELRGLQDALEKLRAEIEEKKVLVRPVRIHQQTETTLFDLGAERLLVITADNIRIEGWDGPQVKCVLEKTVLAADDKPVDEHLKGLQVVHRHGPAPNLVGRPAAETDAGERKFLASPDGKKLDEQGRKSRHALVHQIAGAYGVYREFQGKAIDTLEIEGLTHEQGNRQIVVGIKVPGGGGTLGSDWQRHAALTVYAPRCKSVALRGCLAGLDVADLHASLVLTRAGSQNRDYNGTFRVRNLNGDLTADNVPLDLVDSVHGNVQIISTLELANTGVQHEGGQRTAYTPPPRVLVCRNIDGDFSAWFTRGDLKLTDISGRIDVRNEFGDTTLVAAAPIAAKSHRLLSESGRIEVQLTRDATGDLPIQALTNCGTVRTNAHQDFLEDTSFSTGATAEKVGRDSRGRDWRGVKSARKASHGPESFSVGPESFFAGMERLDAVLTGDDRTSGLDLISRGGTVIVTVNE
jgi:hypothetical protein